VKAAPAMTQDYRKLTDLYERHIVLICCAAAVLLLASIGAYYYWSLL
jgi:hypothetical protein